MIRSLPDREFSDYSLFRVFLLSANSTCNPLSQYEIAET